MPLLIWVFSWPATPCLNMKCACCFPFPTMFHTVGIDSWTIQSSLFFLSLNHDIELSLLSGHLFWGAHVAALQIRCIEENNLKLATLNTLFPCFDLPVYVGQGSMILPKKVMFLLSVLKLLKSIKQQGCSCICASTYSCLNNYCTLFCKSYKLYFTS